MTLVLAAVAAVLALPSTAAAQRLRAPDTTPPGPVVPITPLQVATTGSTVSIDWGRPAGEGPGTTYRITLCDPAGGRALPNARFIPVALGVSTLQVVAVDRAGNSDPAQVRRG